MDNSTKQHFCLNCDYPFPEDIIKEEEFFCPNCGQSSKDSRLSFFQLIKDAVSNVLNLDNRLIHTFRDLIRPSKLTRNYIQGRRKYYVNPARLFIFTLIGLITLTLFRINLENNSMGVDESFAKTERSKVKEEYVQFLDSIDITGSEVLLDTLRKTLFKGVRDMHKDTLGREGVQLLKMSKPLKEYGIMRYDALHLPQEELFAKYNVTSFWDKLNIGQYIRIMTNPAGGIKYVIKNMTWAIFITVILISLIMKLLYIRNNYYLVEHGVLILNSHSLLFIMLTIVILAFPILHENAKEWVRAIAISSLFIFTLIVQFLTLKKYYRQGIFKTLVKQFLINTAYVIIFNLSILFVSIISLILY